MYLWLRFNTYPFYVLEDPVSSSKSANQPVDRGYQPADRGYQTLPVRRSRGSVTFNEPQKTMDDMIVAEPHQESQTPGAQTMGDLKRSAIQNQWLRQQGIKVDNNISGIQPSAYRQGDGRTSTASYQDPSPAPATVTDPQQGSFQRHSPFVNHVSSPPQQKRSITPIQQPYQSPVQQPYQSPVQQPYQSPQMQRQQPKRSITPISMNCPASPVVQQKSRIALVDKSTPRSYTPVQHANRSNTPVQNVGRSNTPVQHVGRSNTPVQHVGRAITPVQHVGRSTTPVQMVGHSNTPAQMVGRSTTPVQMVGRTTPVQMVGRSTTPVQMVGRSTTPIQFVGRSTTPVQQQPPISEPGQKFSHHIVTTSPVLKHKVPSARRQSQETPPSPSARRQSQETPASPSTRRQSHDTPSSPKTSSKYSAHRGIFLRSPSPTGSTSSTPAATSKGLAMFLNQLEKNSDPEDRKSIVFSDHKGPDGRIRTRFVRV